MANENAWLNLTKLPYLNSIIDEVNRFASPTGMLARGVDDKYKLIGKDKFGKEYSYSVQSNRFFKSQMLVCVSNIHHDKEFWQNPEIFDPSRFMCNENDAAKQAFITEQRKYLMPFSVGNRSCVAGQSNINGFAAVVAKSVIAYFITNYDLELDPAFHNKPLAPIDKDSFYRRWETCFVNIRNNTEHRQSYNI